MWRRIGKIHHHHLMNSKRSRGNSIEIGVNVNILEGIRFYVSFCLFFELFKRKLKLMEGSAKIISLIARDENQHLAITQNILNKWKSGDDPQMRQIAKEQEWVYTMFDRAVNEEKG